MTDEELIAAKTKEINRLQIQKRELAEFMGRDKTSHSQREAFTMNYAEFEGNILRLQGQIRLIQTKSGK